MKIYIIISLTLNSIIGNIYFKVLANTFKHPIIKNSIFIGKIVGALKVFGSLNNCLSLQPFSEEKWDKDFQNNKANNIKNYKNAEL